MAADSPLRDLADRELATLALIAEGLSNEAIASRIHVSVKTVEAVCTTVFRKLGLDDSPEVNRRVRAAVLYVNHAPSSPDSLAIPSRWTSFVGRGGELDDIIQLLERHRWLTITGPGGSGKTSLAIALAAGHQRAGGRARFVDLVPVSTPAGVVDAICDAFGVVAPDGRVGLRRVRELVGSDPLLLVIDNAETLRAAVKDVIRDLAPLPNLTIVVTSRASLQSTDEHVWVIPPLRVDDAQELLKERTARHLDDESLAVICAATDGMPLAIELVAARIDALGPEQVVSRLGELPTLLALQGSVDRHASIAAVLELSYAALTPIARDAFRTLALLPAGFTIEVAQQCVDHTVAERIPAALDELESASLVALTDGRYRILEPVRQYGADLFAPSDRRRADRRIVDWALEHASSAAKLLLAQPAVATAQLQRDEPNLVAAIDTAMARHWTDDALRLVARLGNWWTTSHGATHLARALVVIGGCDGGQDDRLYGRALVSTANLGALIGNTDHDWQAMFERAVELLDDVGDDVGLGTALYWSAYHTGSPTVLDRALAIAEQTGNNLLLGWALIHSAALLARQGRPFHEQLALLERAEAIARRSKLPVVGAAALMQRVACTQLDVSVHDGDLPTDLVSMADEAEAVMRASGGTSPITPMHEIAFLQARLRLDIGDLDGAERYVVEALDIAAECGSRPILGEALVMGAALLERRGHEDDARRLIDMCNELTAHPWNRQWHPLLPPLTRHHLGSASPGPTAVLTTDRLESVRCEARQLTQRRHAE